jgi:IS4 transposase
VIADQTIALDGTRSRQDYPVHLRRIRFRDPETGKTLVFLTNQTTLPASTICDLYKSRWKVELFFKWIKQHLRIKRFYGTSENAVKTQIWIAVSVYVLVAIVRKRLNVEASLYSKSWRKAHDSPHFLPSRSCADSDRFPTRSGDFVDECASWERKRRTYAMADD